MGLSSPECLCSWSCADSQPNHLIPNLVKISLKIFLAYSLCNIEKPYVICVQRMIKLVLKTVLFSTLHDVHRNAATHTWTESLQEDRRGLEIGKVIKMCLHKLF